MGTYYAITASGLPQEKIQYGIDSILTKVNAEVNTYIENSVISEYNRLEVSVDMAVGQGHFLHNLKRSLELHKSTFGYFNPCIGPLVRYWGFDEDRLRSNEFSADTLQKILTFCQVSNLIVEEEKGKSDIVLRKKYAEQRLDFNAIAKGYAVDVISEWLEDCDVNNYLVDIGGEVRVKGKNPKGKKWTIAISQPSASAGLDEAYNYVRLSDGALATSGNYRNRYSKGDSLIVHTINPFTGQSEINDLLSVTILSEDCQTADAIATACMSAGLQKALEIVGNHQGIEAYFIYISDNREVRDSATLGMKQHLYN